MRIPNRAVLTVEGAALDKDLESGVMPVAREAAVSEQDAIGDEVQLGCEAIMNQVAVIDMNLEFLALDLRGEARVANADARRAVERIAGVVQTLRRVVQRRDGRGPRKPGEGTG